MIGLEEEGLYSESEEETDEAEDEAETSNITWEVYYMSGSKLVLIGVNIIVRVVCVFFFSHEAN